MFNVSTGWYNWSHRTHQADKPILAKRVLALCCRWLQQLQLFELLVYPRFLEREAYRSVLSLTTYESVTLINFAFFLEKLPHR